MEHWTPTTVFALVLCNCYKNSEIQWKLLPHSQCPYKYMGKSKFISHEMELKNQGSHRKTLSAIVWEEDRAGRGSGGTKKLFAVELLAPPTLWLMRRTPSLLHSTGTWGRACCAAASSRVNSGRKTWEQKNLGTLRSAGKTQLGLPSCSLEYLTTFLVFTVLNPCVSEDISSLETFTLLIWSLMVNSLQDLGSLN